MKDGLGICEVSYSYEMDEYSVTFNCADLHMEGLNSFPEGYKSIGKIGLVDSAGDIYFIIEQVEKVS